MTISELTLKSSAEEPVRRFEVFTGVGRRREWAPEDKARIVAESLEPGATVSAVARRHALSPQQLFTWRREARKASEMIPAFVPAVVAPEPAPASEPSAPPSQPKRRGRQRRAAAIEVDVAGVRVRIENGASPATIAAVIGALKARS
ncbi:MULTISPECIES: IS66-like element accessory protein TnpA [Xanthobacter]|uniref:IS66-like element accessory protein TnpA n=1 Tax=Xanthobacter TaxID=279 RepID=UPI0024A66DD1|nr:transposase [Xanthobacter autotrophicus]MDI4658250.1 transposase [Xanthobacter autotrophicus]